MVGSQNNNVRATVLFVPLTFSGALDATVNHLQTEHYSVLIHEPGMVMSHKDNKLIDVIMLDCRQSGFDPDFDTGIVDGLRKEHPEAVFMFLTDIAVSGELRLQMKKYGSICATGTHTELLTIRLNRLLENLALADECGERLKTLLSLNNGNMENGGLKTSSKALNILVAGSPSPLSLRAMKSLGGNHANISAAITVPQTISYLENHKFDCLVLVPGTKAASHISLIKLLRRNGRTKTLPILVLSEDDDLETSKTGARYLYQGADLILGDQDTERQLMQEVAAFSKRSRLTNSMKQFLRKSVSVGTEKKKFACSIPFFETHLARQCASSQKSGKPLCLSAFRFHTKSGHPVSKHMQRQALSYIDLIVQDIDLVTAAQKDIVLVSHPFTTLVDTARICKRISSVLQDISFRNERQSDHKDRLIVAGSSVFFDSAEHPEELITRALKGMTELPRSPKATKTEKPYLSLVQ